MSNKGTTIQVVGPVVDVQFENGHVPQIYNALHIDYNVAGTDTKVVCEVQQHLGEGLVRAVAMTIT